MKTYRFRTNLKCNGCIGAVTPYLNTIQGVLHWKVCLSTYDRILEVDAETDIANEIITALGKAGYRAENITPNKGTQP